MSDPNSPFPHLSVPPRRPDRPIVPEQEPAFADPGILEIPPRKPVDPGASSWLSPEYRDRLASIEADQRGYATYRPNKPGEAGIGAWGRYQFRGNGLIDAGIIPPFDSNTIPGEDLRHITNYLQRNFLTDPAKQEEALAASTKFNKEKLQDWKAHGWETIGRQVQAGDGTTFTITAAGLAAAAHYAGAAGMLRYLRRIRVEGWRSDPKTFPAGLEENFTEIEQRLRLFDGVPLRAAPHR